MVMRVKGTQDFLDLRLYNFIIDQFKKHIELYYFTEIATPIIEPVELFKRLLGEYTDVVSKEMFLIKPAKESSEALCLRPEVTASTMRAFLEGGIQTTPWKVYSSGPMFRYERPQKGRYRQFHQINIEVVGSYDISDDVQFIKMLDRFFHEQVQLNNYALQLNFLGCQQDRADYGTILHSFLDKSDELICDTCKIRKEKNRLRIFDCKQEKCQSLYTKAPRIADHLCEICAQEWNRLQEELQLLSVSFTYNPSLVRGLDYYEKTVFEFSSANLGAQNAFCGGGRYELAKQLGAPEAIPSIGASIGIERFMLLLEPTIDSLLLPQLPRLQVIIPLEKELHPLALLIGDDLQSKGLAVDILFEPGSIKSKMKKANKMGAAYVLIIGTEERDKRSVMVKNMITGEQKEVLQIDLGSYLQL